MSKRLSPKRSQIEDQTRFHSYVQSISKYDDRKIRKIAQSLEDKLKFLRSQGKKLLNTFEGKFGEVQEDVLSIHDILKNLKAKTDTLSGQVTANYQKHKTLKVKLNSFH